MSKQQRIDDDAAKKAALNQRKTKIQDSNISDLDYFLMGISSANKKSGESEMEAIKSYLDNRDINITEFDYTRFLLFDSVQHVKDIKLLMGKCQYNNDPECNCCDSQDIEAATNRQRHRKCL